MSIGQRACLTRLASGVVGLSLVDVEWIPTPPTDEVTGVAVRGVRFFDDDAINGFALPHWKLRFDVLGKG